MFDSSPTPVRIHVALGSYRQDPLNEFIVMVIEELFEAISFLYCQSSSTVELAEIADEVISRG